MITVTFTAPSHVEINSMIRNYLVELDGDTPRPNSAARAGLTSAIPLQDAATNTRVMPLSGETSTNVASTPVSEGEKPAGRRGRPRKEEPAAAPEAPPVADQPPAAAPTSGNAPTVEEAQAALAKLAERRGIQAARDICKEFAVANVKVLPADKVAAFIERCDALVNEA